MSAPQGRNNLERLERELSALGSRMMEADETKAGEMKALAKEFLEWAGNARRSKVPDSERIHREAQMVLQGLERGRPAAQAFGKLSNLMSEASQRLQVPPPPVPAAKTAETAPSGGAAAPVGENFLVVPPEDAPGFQEFLGEAPVLLESIESGLMAVSRGGQADILEVFRPFHTLKGICGFMGLKGLGELAHRAETFLDPYKKSGSSNLPEDLVDFLLGVVDLFRDQVGLIAAGLPGGKFKLVVVPPLEGPTPGGIPAMENAAAVHKAPSVSAPSPEAKTKDHSLRIVIEKMDALLEAVGELVICQSQVVNDINLSGAQGRLAAEASRLGKISRNLQDIVLSLRMVPVEPLFLRMSRLARDLSQKTGKPLALLLEGGETELDKNLIEELAEPLLHLIRNAVDHGVEQAEKRLAAGKPAQATLSLKARHQGGHFILEVSDDGDGINFEKLAEKGKALGLLKEGDGKDEERLTELIFEAGFSTAREVTDVSGRGVGLDVVRRKIRSLKGDIQVQSRRGQGTRFTLRIPLTLALMDGVLVRVGVSRYILPAFHVRQFMALAETGEHQVGSGRQWLDARGENLPLVDLGEWFGCVSDGKGRAVVVQVEASGHQGCLVVDEVIGKQQVVVKGLGESLEGLKGVTGGAILGDGRVEFILDVGALVGEQAVQQAVN